MRRVDLPEIEDQAWCPAWLRDAMTGYLQAVIERARPYDVSVNALTELLESDLSPHILDLASGAGGPWPQLLPTLREKHPSLRVTLSDLNPNTAAAPRLESELDLVYRRESVSALEPPTEDVGLLTIFTGLHHFSLDDVALIMRRAQESRVGFAAFEATQRSTRGVLLTAIIPLLVLLLMPSVKPRRPLPLLLTYLPPLLPLVIWWDGLASTLRTHSIEDILSVIREISDPAYVWRVEEIPVPGAPIPVLQVIGRPA